MFALKKHCPRISHQMSWIESMWLGHWDVLVPKERQILAGYMCSMIILTRPAGLQQSISAWRPLVWVQQALCAVAVLTLWHIPEALRSHQDLGCFWIQVPADYTFVFEFKEICHLQMWRYRIRWKTHRKCCKTHASKTTR